MTIDSSTQEFARALDHTELASATGGSHGQPAKSQVAVPLAAGGASRAMLRAVINTHVGSRIRALRLCSGTTQAELGDVLGLTNQQVQKYEKGTNAMNLDKAWCTADYFGVDVGYFVEGLGAVVARRLDGKAALSDDLLEYRRLRLALAEALHRTRSPQLLRSMLQLLQAAADDDDPATDSAKGEDDNG
jgi:transcriptional regulator with XRE-family HTH domain